MASCPVYLILMRSGEQEIGQYFLGCRRIQSLPAEEAGALGKIEA
jgi:hypothetical protein